MGMEAKMPNSQLPRLPRHPSHPPVIPDAWRCEFGTLRNAFSDDVSWGASFIPIPTTCWKMSAWRINPFGKWFLDHLPIYMPCRPFGRGTTPPVRGLTNHGCWLTKWDDPRSILTSLDVFFYRFKVKSTHLPPKKKLQIRPSELRKKNCPWNTGCLIWGSLWCCNIIAI